MNFQSGRQQLLDSSKQLSYRWSKVREVWQDQKADSFHKNYIQNLERQLKASLDSINEIDEIFKEIQKDCF
ncbi:MAG: hypothetical protein NE328_13625 [Lentisphaeraceae bacterium]|nr:hypothetical protein [Lentisphaeraceae bacterium]